VKPLLSHRWSRLTTGLLALATVTLSAAQAQNITLRLQYWPFQAAYSEEEMQKTANLRAHKDLLDSWLKQNPGVTLEQTNINVWDSNVIRTAVAGGNSPVYISTGAIGNWTRQGFETAVKQGLAPDVTDTVKKLNVDKAIPSYWSPLWKRYAINGKFYEIPWSYDVGFGITYRKDIFKKYGIAEPTANWTWDDFYRISKQISEKSGGKTKGAYLDTWRYIWALTGDGLTEMSRVPDPASNFNWKFDFTPNMDRWVNRVQLWRTAIHQDKSVAANRQNPNDFGWLGMLRDDFAMITDFGRFGGDPGNEKSMLGFSKKMGKPAKDLFGWIPAPKGQGGYPSMTRGSLATLIVDPNLNKAAQEKAVSLLIHMWFGDDNYVRRQQVVFKQTKDPASVYDQAFPRTELKSVPGIPGNFGTYYGARTFNNLQNSARFPVVPIVADYLDAEPNATLDLKPDENAAFKDILADLVHQEGNLSNAEVAERLEKAEQTLNAQAAGFRSVIPDDKFKQQASNYYTALNDYFKKVSPTFYTRTYKPWFDKNVAARLK
jgi:hypothetical protein